MKIPKQRLLQIIKEELQEKDSTELANIATSASAMKAADIERNKQVGKETTSQEVGILNQIEDFLAKLAATPGVDLMQKRALLEKILKLLQQNIKGKIK